MTDFIYSTVYQVASVLELPVVLLILAALLMTIVESGAFVAELWQRRGRSLPGLVRIASAARAALDRGDRDAADASGSAEALLRPLASSAAMARTLTAIARAAGTDEAEARIAKELADFDFSRERRLGRTRILVRFGPALGLMGTLIPLSPALAGLAKGNVTALTENLQVAFSVTVLGLLVGSVAFALSLVRERLYAQDYSDLEYVAATLTGPAPDLGPVAEPARLA